MNNHMPGWVPALAGLTAFSSTFTEAIRHIANEELFVSGPSNPHLCVAYGRHFETKMPATPYPALAMYVHMR